MGLWKREGEAWYSLAVGVSDVPGEEVAPGDTRQFCVWLSGEASGSIHSAQDPVEAGGVWQAGLCGLGGGEYAFGVFGDLIEPLASEGRPVGTVARVTVDGPPIAVTQTGRVAEVRTGGDVVRGRWSPGLGADDAPSTAYVLRRIPADRPAVPLIAEQLVGPWGPRPLGDAVALAREHDVRAVALVGGEDAFGSQALPPYPISYEGESFTTRLEAP